MDNNVIENAGEISQESKNLALLLWIGTIILGFIPGLVFYLTKKEDSYLIDQSIEALNWSITVIIAYSVAVALTLILIGAIFFPLIGLCHLVFCLMGAVATSNGKPFRTPFAIRLMK